MARLIDKLSGVSDPPGHSYRFGRVVVLAITGGVTGGPAHPVMVGWPETRRSGGRARDWVYVDGGRLARRFTESSVV